MIRWDTDESGVLINPRAPERERAEAKEVEQFLQQMKGHLAIATSGTSGQIKWTALSKEALLCSASAVNRHLQSDGNDIWLNPLPHFHVGGLGILARCFLSGANCENCLFPQDKWSPEAFMDALVRSRATLTSLVPTQVYDLIKCDAKAPAHLRAVVVGGGALNETLYFAAKTLGWNLLPSYGMTEVCSQIATASLCARDEGRYPLLVPLDHVELKGGDDGCLMIKSNALLSGYIERGEKGIRLHDPKEQGWYRTEDVAEFDRGGIARVSRKSGFIKVGGESVDLNRLEGVLQQVMLEQKAAGDAVLDPVADERLGHVIGLRLTHGAAEKKESVVEAFNRRVFPYERIRSCKVVEAIPRTALGKRKIGLDWT